ncbi:C4-dicarboxylate ABC transporter [Pokkaliibacter plantistimulans]|uniref:C4-dicarboxylate ABC transporter n=2 Tax=Pseudomonadota TaxID=1224 RepID=A0ABX5M2C4_9GAMM|nr:MULTISPECIES: sigma-54 dependent transcriptional regulator [Pokkaliibacter]MDH2432327.1 sigma-54 dependent transcriptional regulator [Pokkaliibacter sp. MBI-7]PPC75307.1 DNA-binding response regulator [Pokkaliibacter plantistimulans]PXF33064.1 C4-dicarboxylate ABC transporter [Pokkaliibacter plantistimulans]
MALPIIFVDDEQHIRMAVSQTLEIAGYEVHCLERADKVLSLLVEDWPGVVITDINMPGLDGLALMQQVHQHDADLPVILITGHGDISMAVNAIRDGAYDFIEKPFPADLLLDVVKRAMEKRSLTLENRQLRQELASHATLGPRVLGKTEVMQRMRRLISQIAPTSADVMLHGETGTGKELIARYIHESSPRHNHNFVAINCGAVAESIMESELFGHEQGAFTDAKQKRIGKFEYANGGTLFLDEIESMPMSLQIKLLRVLEERAIERLGSNELIPLDIRIIAATKIDLLKLAETGEFRKDLYYRLNIVEVHIPALRERREDVPLLFHHFTLVASALYKREVLPPSASQVHALLTHNWPGNVRELRNLAERYVLLGEACTFEFDRLLQSPPSSPLSLPEQVELFEKMLIQTELERHGGSIKDTMEALSVPRKTLSDKMRKYGLDKSDYK